MVTRLLRALGLGLASLAPVLVGCAPIAPSPDHTSVPATEAAPRTPSASVIAAPVVVRIGLPDPDTQAPFADQLAVTNGAIWIELETRPVRLLRVDTELNRITAIVDLAQPVGLFSDGDGGLWAVGPWGGAPGPSHYTVSRVDLDTGQLTDVATVPPLDLAVGLGSIWVADLDGLRRFDVRTGALKGTIDLRVDTVQVACGAIWGWDADSMAMERVDPITEATTSYLGPGPVYAYHGGCYRWAAGGLRPVDSTEPGLDRVNTGPPDLVFDGRSFWGRPARELQRYDPIASMPIGPRWSLDPRELVYPTKVGVDAKILAAGGSIWLIRADEVVRYDIAA
jgi:hypothetical protein